MIALLQRVSGASVMVEDTTIGAIDRGLLVLLAVERADSEGQARRLLERLLSYRVFPDETGRMNRDLRETAGGLLLVPQFTLAADTGKGTRPSFSPAAAPERGRELFELMVGLAAAVHRPVAAGRFGADMRVASVNEGPVTFWLRTPPEPVETGRSARGD